MKKYLAILLATVLLFAMFAGCAKEEAPATTPPANKLEAIQQAGKIVMCTSPDYAPYEFEDLSKQGQEAYVGSDIELGKYIAEQLGVELEIKAMDFQTCLEAITQGTVDMGITGLAYKEDRAQTMQLVGPYNLESDSYQGALIKKDSGIDTIEDLAGKKIGAQSGSLQYSYAETYGGEGSEITPITDLALGVMMLEEGKIDVLIISSTTGEGFAANYNDLVMSEIRFPNTDGTFVGITNGETELAAAIQAIVDEAESSGKCAQWVEDAKALATSLGIEQ
ncbi:MAG TPA: transporter substrate-binding domain-containing protein [Candidatus Acidoferrum sp.]|nr:transporter substrate-binding domain-containing protein [Candidatus Acidoferrum sp.]